MVVPAKDGKPEQLFSFLVRFSLHCFSETTKHGDDPQLAYRDSRESRTFDFDRYRLSHHLPETIRDIGSKHCMHTGQSNFFVIELVDDDGTRVEYEIYFDVNKNSGVAGRLELFVQSAYVRGEASRAFRQKGKKIRFSVIAHNRKHGKPIKAPR